MITLADYRLIKDLEKMAERLGFKIDQCRYHMNLIALCPGDNDALPCYSRDAVLASGTAEELMCFLRGWEGRATYDRMLGFNEKKVARSEQNVRNDLLMIKLKEEHKKDHAK